MALEKSFCGNYHAGSYSFKVPVIWRDAADAWFNILETQFQAASITNWSIKYACLTAALTPEIAKDVSHVLRQKCQGEASYHKLKKAILTLFLPNEQIDFSKQANARTLPPRNYNKAEREEVFREACEYFLNNRF